MHTRHSSYCRKFAYYKNDILLKLVTSPMWRTSHWWQICYHNRTSYFIHPIFPHETSKFWFRLPTYNYETNLIRQFLIFSCKIQYIRLNFNNSTVEWGNNYMILRASRSNISSSSVNCRNGTVVFSENTTSIAGQFKSPELARNS
jgi:hypothetical protein